MTDCLRSVLGALIVVGLTAGCGSVPIHFDVGRSGTSKIVAHVTVGEDSTSSGDGRVSVEGVLVTVGSDGCAQYPDSCGGVRPAMGAICGLVPGTVYRYNCSDPILAEWPDSWTLERANWSAPSVSASGTVLVEPGPAYVLPSQFGVLVTDPGYTAHVLRLDVDDVPPTVLELVFEFDFGSQPVGCVKGLDVTIVTPVVPALAPRFLIPTEGLSLNLTALVPPDPRVICGDLATIGVEALPWSTIKRLFR